MNRLNFGAILLNGLVMLLDMPAGSREAFVKTKGNICTMCGGEIAEGNQDTYPESQRCSRCHDELDTASGPIPVLWPGRPFEIART